MPQRRWSCCAEAARTHRIGPRRPSRTSRWTSAPAALRARHQRPVRGASSTRSRAGRPPTTSATPAPASGCVLLRPDHRQARPERRARRPGDDREADAATATSRASSPNLVRADGTVPPVEQVHLHHGTWLVGARLRQRPVLRRRRGEDDRAVPARLRHAGQGHRPVAAALHGPLGGQPADGDLHHLRDRLRPEGRRPRSSGIKPAYPGLARRAARPATRCSTSQRDFGGETARARGPSEQCAALRPVRQEDRRPGRARQRRRARTSSCPKRASRSARIENFTRRHADRHRRPPAPGRADQRDRPRAARRRGRDASASPTRSSARKCAQDAAASASSARSGRRCATGRARVTVSSDRRDRPRIYTGQAAYWDRKDPTQAGRPADLVGLLDGGHRACRTGASTSSPATCCAATRPTTRRSRRPTRTWASRSRCSRPTTPDGKPTAPGVNPFQAPSATRRPTATSGGVQATPATLCDARPRHPRPLRRERQLRRPGGRLDAAKRGQRDQRGRRSPTSSTRPGDLSTASMTGIPTVKLGSNAALHQPRGRRRSTTRSPRARSPASARPAPRSRSPTARRARAATLDLDSSELGIGVAGHRRRPSRRSTGTLPVTAGGGLQARRDRDVLLPHPPVHARRVRGDRSDQLEALGPVGHLRAAAALLAGPARGPAGRRPAVLERGVLPAAADAASSWRSCALADAETERWRRKFGMSRAQFVRTAAATAIGFWAIDAVAPRAASATTAGRTTPRPPHACDLEWDGAQGPGDAAQPAGRVHLRRAVAPRRPRRHVAGDQPGDPRVLRGDLAAVVAGRPATSRRSARAGTSAAAARARSTRSQNLSRYHYLKELFLDSATSTTVLSVRADLARHRATRCRSPRPPRRSTPSTRWPSSQRAVMHAFVMPNRGSAAATRRPASKPLYLDDELELMMERAATYRDILRGWKTYCAWGDVPNASGWFLDTDTGMAFLEQVRAVQPAGPGGPAGGGHPQGLRAAGLRPARAPRRATSARRRKAYPDVRLPRLPLGLRHRRHAARLPRRRRRPTRARNTVDALIKSLRENNCDATQLRQEGQEVRQRAQRLRRARARCGAT